MATKKKTGIILSDNKLQQRYPGAGLASDICLLDDTSLWLPSRILSLNYQLGGGIKYGSIMELYGEESTGKSLLAKDFGVVAQSLGGIVLWNDAEGTFSPHWAKLNGLDLKRTYLYVEPTIELVADWEADMLVRERSKLTNNEPILLVKDSIAAYDTLENFDNSIVDEKAEMGNRAKAIYKMVRRRNKLYVQLGVCVIFINQIRKKVGASQFEDPDKTVGGDAMKFFASQRVGLYQGKQIKNSDDDKVGNLVYVRTKKNKVAPPRPNTKAKVYFTEHEGQLGYDKYTGLMEVLEKQKVLERRKARWYRGDKQLAHGDTAMEQLLVKDKNLRAELVEELGVNTPSKTRKQLKTINRNLYPIKVKSNGKEDEE